MPSKRDLIIGWLLFVGIVSGVTGAAWVVVAVGVVVALNRSFGVE